MEFVCWESTLYEKNSICVFAPRELFAWLSCNTSDSCPWHPEVVTAVRSFWVVSAFCCCAQWGAWRQPGKQGCIDILSEHRYKICFFGKSVLDYLWHPAPCPSTYNIYNVIMYNCIFVNVSLSPRISNFKPGQVTQWTSEQTCKPLSCWGGSAKKRKAQRWGNFQPPGMRWSHVELRSVQHRDEQCLACSCEYASIAAIC